MIQKIIILGLAVAASIWVGMYIQSYNKNSTMNVQERFQDIVDQTSDQAKDLLKEADEQKKKAIEKLQEKKDNFLKQQQKELFGQH